VGVATRFAAILLTAVALIPTAAHLFELPNKIALSRDAYFTVQGIYRGWALFGCVLCGALIANLALALSLRIQRSSFLLALAAGILIAATLGIFFLCTYPANQATANWTTAPTNWVALRQEWEYSHAANALLTLVALCCSILASLTSRD
jgi:hypothetical protein